MKRPALVFLVLVAIAGCSSRNHYEERPFFQVEYDKQAHGRKTWFDHLVEVDPGAMKTSIAPDYEQTAPEKVAVLPFIDSGSAQFVLDKIPLTFRDEQERANYSWTYSQRLRRAFQGYLAQREFVPINLIAVDAVLYQHGINTFAKLQQVPPQELGKWLGADAVVYGEVLHYDAYYAFLFAAWQVGMQVRMTSTRDGHELFSARGSRYAVDIRPAFDMMDIMVNSSLSLLELRDVTLARAEEEVCREMVKRIPESEMLVTKLAKEGLERDNENRMRATQMQAASYRPPASFQRVNAPSGSSSIAKTQRPPIVLHPAVETRTRTAHGHLDGHRGAAADVTRVAGPFPSPRTTAGEASFPSRASSTSQGMTSGPSHAAITKTSSSIR